MYSNGNAKYVRKFKFDKRYLLKRIVIELKKIQLLYVFECKCLTQYCHCN